MGKQKKLYERMLISCVLMLIICVVLKLFGTTWFDLDYGIAFLNKLNNIIMNNIIFSFLFSLLLTYINGFFVLRISTMKHNFLLHIMCFISSIIAVLFEYFIDNTLLCLIVDTLILYFACIVINKRSSINYIICFILNFIFQIISLTLRSVNLDTEYCNVIILTIMNIDYYILLIITLLYLKKGETQLCSVMAVFGSSLQRKLWKKPTQNLKQSSNKGGCKNE